MKAATKERRESEAEKDEMGRNDKINQSTALIYRFGTQSSQSFSKANHNSNVIRRRGKSFPYRGGPEGKQNAMFFKSCAAV